VIQTNCVAKGTVVMDTGMYASFARLKQVPPGSQKQGSSFAMGKLYSTFLLPCQSDLTVLSKRLFWRELDRESERQL